MQLSVTSLCNNKAKIVETDTATVYISYETVVAFRSKATGRTLRRENVWGPMTGRHINQMGVKEFPIAQAGAFAEEFSLL